MTIEDIIETLEKTDMPDSRIDAFITCAFLLKQLRPAEPNDFDGPHDYMPSSIKSEHGFLMARPFTHDVNHAIDLCKRKSGRMRFGTSPAVVRQQMTRFTARSCARSERTKASSVKPRAITRRWR
ncbi:hypothetical protein ACVIRM_001966 [Rhizobium laguerreae]